MLKKYLTAGLLVWLPLAITVWVLDAIVQISDHLIVIVPQSWLPSTQWGVHIPGLGLLIAFAIVLFTGVITANFLGQKLVYVWEKLLARIPIVRPIYAGVKQIADTLLSQNAKSFKEVVYVQFPQAEHWTLGFIVSTPSLEMQADLNAVDKLAVSAQAPADEWLTVYVPTAPNPTSGYVLFVRPHEIRRADISVDDAFKFHVSLGVLCPPPKSKKAQTDHA